MSITPHTPDLLDKHLDAVLRAAGSGLRHYSMQKTLDDMRAAMRDAMEASTTARTETPAAKWHQAGEADPHGTRYDCGRNDLAMGDLTDDELANGAFLNYDMPMNIEAIMSKKPGYHPPIAWMTAVKDRIRWLSRQLTAASAPASPTHPDDDAVDRFAAAMKAKLAKAREKGRSGWDDRTTCTQDQLARALRQHTHKGDPVDVANFAMFLHARGESTNLFQDPALTAAIAAAPKDATVIKHNGFPVFLNRGNAAWKEMAESLERMKDLAAVVTSIKHLAGEIVLQMSEGEEVPQWLEAGAEVSLLTEVDAK